MNISVIFAPQEIDLLPQRDLTRTTCVVFDVLRATSAMLAALDAGAKAIKPVAEISEALAEKHMNPEVLLAGERDGVRIGAKLTGGVEFDLGNSPREMTRGKVSGRILVSTTTNGTRAIRACPSAAVVAIASFGNLTGIAHWLAGQNPQELILVCSGTGEKSCLEDTAGAGALIRELGEIASAVELEDSAIMARHVFNQVRNALEEKVGAASNARRLLSMPALAHDVLWCLETDRFLIVPTLDRQGYLSC
jgi:2-phosphosulfolactate phosphatase